MAIDNAKNFAKVKVSAGYSATDFTITLNTGDGAKLPTAPFNVVWWNISDYPDPSDDPNVEIDRVTNVVGDVLTLANAGGNRTAQEGTAASTKNTAGKTYRMIAGLTAKVINTDFASVFVPYTGATADLNLDASYQVTAKKFITSGASSSQFVKGDGSLDSSVYLTSLAGALLADGTVVGAVSQTQAFTNGIVVGGGTAQTILTAYNTSTSDPRGILSIQINDGTQSARLGFWKARGTILAPTTVQSGDMLGRLLFRGYDGASWLEMGSIDVGTTGTIGTGRVPTTMSFKTATNANPSVLIEGLFIDNDQTIKLTHYTTAGFVKTNETGVISIDTNTYLTSLAGAFLLNQTSPQTVINGAPIFGAGLNVGTTSTGANTSLNATVGAEMVAVPPLTTSVFTRGNWTLTSGWSSTNDSDTQLDKNAGGVTTATLNTVAAVVGTTYKVTITVNAFTANSGCRWSFGGTYGTLLTSATTFTSYITAQTTDGLVFTPINTATRFTINSISIKPLTNTTGTLFVGGNTTIAGPITNPITIQNNFSADSAYQFASPGLILQNSTPATVSVYQNTPSLSLYGTAWNATAVASSPYHWDIYGVGSTSSQPGLSYLNFYSSFSGLILQLSGYTSSISTLYGYLTVTKDLQANGKFTTNTASMTTTSTDGYVAVGQDASSAGNPVRMSPRIRITGHAWNTTPTAADNSINFIQEVLPVSGATTSGSLNWSYDNNGGGYTNIMGLSNTGLITLPLSTSQVYFSLNSTGRNILVSNNAGPVYTGISSVGVVATSSSTSIGYTSSPTSLLTPILTAYHSASIDAVGIGTITPTNILSLSGQAARTIWMERETTAATAGNDLTLQAGGAVSGGTDLNGGKELLAPGISTGMGMASVRLQALTRSATTATADNTLYDSLIIPAEKNLTNSSPVGLFTIALPTLGMTGGTIEYTITSSDGTDMQSHSGIVHFTAVNKGGVYTTDIQDSDTVGALKSTATSSGTLTDTWTITTGTNIITINCQANSSLTPTNLKIHYTIRNGGTTAVTQL